MIIPCETCGVKRLTPIGPVNAEILIIGDEPDDEDMLKSIPFGSKKGDVLYGELARVGIQFPKCRLTYLWQHSIPPVNPKTHKRPCDGHMAEAMKEMKGRDAVLLVGANTVKAFELPSVSDIAGLCVESIYFPKNVKFVMCSSQPPTSDCIGEFRLVIEKFAKKLKEVNFHGE